MDCCASSCQVCMKFRACLRVRQWTVSIRDVFGLGVVAGFSVCTLDNSRTMVGCFGSNDVECAIKDRTKYRRRTVEHRFKCWPEEGLVWFSTREDIEWVVGLIFEAGTGWTGSFQEALGVFRVATYQMSLKGISRGYAGICCWSCDEWRQGQDVSDRDACMFWGRIVSGGFQCYPQFGRFDIRWNKYVREVRKYRRFDIIPDRGSSG